MGSNKRDLRTMFLIIGVTAICVYCAFSSITKDRESKGKTEAIHISGESQVISIEMPDDSMDTLKSYIEKLKEGFMGDE